MILALVTKELINFVFIDIHTLAIVVRQTTRERERERERERSDSSLSCGDVNAPVLLAVVSGILRRNAVYSVCL